MKGNEKWLALCQEEKEWKKGRNIKSPYFISKSTLRQREMLKRHSEWKKQRGITPSFLRARSVV